MDLGVYWDYDEIDQANFDPSPFWVLSQNEKITLGKRYKSGKLRVMIRLNTYENIWGLFAEFFYKRPWYCHISEETDTKIKTIIDRIYAPPFTHIYTSSQRYALYRQFTKHQLQLPADHIPTPFLHELSNSGLIEGAPCLPIPQTYEEGLEQAFQLKYDLPDSDILIFNNSESVLWWALERIISRNQEISKCEICQSYFIASTPNQRYCSRQCFQNNRAIGKYCGDKEIERAYMALYQWFYRRSNSKQEYIYNASLDKSDIITKLLPERKKNVPIAELRLSASDFEFMMSKFQEEYNERYLPFKNAIQKQKDGEFDSSNDETVNLLRNALYSWLTDAKAQLYPLQRE